MRLHHPLKLHWTAIAATVAEPPGGLTQNDPYGWPSPIGYGRQRRRHTLTCARMHPALMKHDGRAEASLIGHDGLRQLSGISNLAA
jgi:hypothetical protein